MRTFKYLIVLAFTATFLQVSAQNREPSTLTPSDISSMTWVEAMQDYRVNFHTVVDKFNVEFDGKPYEKGHGWKQFKRWEHMMEERVGESGVRPHPSVLYQAIQQQQASATTEYGEWSVMGPVNAPSGGGIGRINGVAFHPNHHDTIYAGAPAGGLWVSYDDGQSWTTFTDELTNLGVSDLAIDPLHPDTMYLATGDRDAADTYSFGLLKSTDGGITWNTTSLSWSTSQNYRIARIVVHPDSTHIVMAATNAGVYRSTNYGQNFTLEQSGSFYGMRMGHGDTVFATTSGSTPKLYRSLDAGDTWSQMSNGLPTSGKYRCEVAVSSVPGKVYLVYGDSNYGFGGLYRSTNGGSNWTLMSSTPNIMGWSNNGSGSGGQAWYDLTIACDPNSENTIYVGGVNIWKSTNGGTNWTCVGHWYGAGSTPYVHADHHHADFRPGTSELYVGTDGGIYKTTNSGGSWSDLNDGMNITQYYKISQSTSDTTVILAGAQDNGSHLRSSTINWSEVTGGDGMDNGVDAVNDNLMYTSIYYGDFYKSTNGGGFFSSINTLSVSGSGNWVTPFNTDPVSTNTVYAGFKKIWKSTNAGGSWSATSSNNISGNSNIDEFEVAPSNTNYIYTLINTNIYVSTNGGSSWSSITPTGSMSPSSNNISGVAIDPNDEEHIVISISGYNGYLKVLESNNAGSTWSNLSSGLPNVPATAVAFEGGTSDGIYVGTDIGMYYTSSNFSSWISFNKNLPNVIVSDIEIYADDALIRIGTYGRGVWQSPLKSGFTNAPIASFTADPLATCSLGDTISLTDLSSGLPTSWYWQITPSTFSFVGGTNDSSQFPKLAFNATGAYTVTLTASNNYGTDDKTAFQILGVGGASLPFIEDFESGLTGWEIANPDAGITWAAATVNGTSPGSTGMTINHYSYSTTGAVDELISPALDFTNDTLINLEFEYASAYYSSGYKDSLKVYVSDDCGSTWNLVAAYDGSDASFTTAGAVTPAFAPADSTYWCHGSSSVTCPTIDLDAYSGTAGVRVKFVAVNGYGNNIYLDNINISGKTSIVKFSADSIACKGASVNFNDESWPIPTSRKWLFQGGSPAISFAVNPTVVYTSPGTYDVKLIVSNGLLSDSVISENFIKIKSPSSTDVISSCGSYIWIDGNTYTSSNTTATTTLTSSTGCDSVVTLNLTVNAPATGTDVISSCGSYIWIDGNTYTSSNTTATTTLTSSTGCDSVVTLNLTVNAPATGTDVISSCGSYIWIDGNTYTSSNTTATTTLTSSTGCDSVVTLNLTVNAPATGTDVISSCGSYIWIDGNTYTSSNTTATTTLTSSTGCDSVVTLNLTVNAPATGTDVISSCGSYIWIDGNTYTSSNTTATTTLTSSTGCDSVVTLNLTVNAPATGTDVISSCGSYIWIDGNTYTSSNTTATTTLTSSTGCDSVVTLNLTVNAPATGTDVISSCGSYIWIDGNTYTSSNTTATTTLTSSTGCDSVVTLNLTVNAPATGTDVISSCGSYIWIDGNTYTSSNTTATTTLTSSTGCDSVVTLNLTVNAPATGTDVISSCGSYIWIDGNTYTSSNTTATTTLTSSTGCDSVVTLNLTVNAPATGTDVISSCGSYIWIDGNTYTSSNTTATTTLTSSTGCDSVVTLNLTVNAPATGTDVISSCGSYIWIDGNTYTSSNTTATTTLTSSTGCDSVVTLNLTVNAPATGTDVISSCGSYIWIDGNTYTSSNTTATTTLTSSTGCDSVVTLNLTVNAPATGTDVISSCGSYIWIDGNTYTSNNTTATTTLTSSTGCDSVVTLNLTVNAPATGTDVISSCGSYIWIDGNTYTSNNTTATTTLTSSTGCDSVVTLNLTLYNINTILVRTYDILSAPKGYASYQWLGCENGSYIILNNQVNDSLVLVKNGDYAVVITDNGCSDTSLCHSVQDIGQFEQDIFSFSLFPNPTTNKLRILFMGSQLMLEQEKIIKITSLTGQTVFSFKQNGADDIVLDLDGLPSSPYMIYIISGNKVFVERISKVN